MKEKIFTIGHSTHEIGTFLSLLKKHGITAVCDVRSSPFSRFNSQFNRENLKSSLLENGIKYVFLGEELGARSSDPACYEERKVQYARLAKTELFRTGLERIHKGAEDYTIALMCAEKDPIECHRTILVSRELERKDSSIFHILDNGEIEAHENTIARLIRKLNIGDGDLFLTEDEIRDRAYEIQASAIGYTMPEESDQRLQTNEVG